MTSNPEACPYHASIMSGLPDWGALALLVGSVVAACLFMVVRSECSTVYRFFVHPDLFKRYLCAEYNATTVPNAMKLERAMTFCCIGLVLTTAIFFMSISPIDLNGRASDPVGFSKFVLVTLIGLDILVLIYVYILTKPFRALYKKMLGDASSSEHKDSAAYYLIRANGFYLTMSKMNAPFARHLDVVKKKQASYWATSEGLCDLAAMCTGNWELYNSASQQVPEIREARDRLAAAGIVGSPSATPTSATPITVSISPMPEFTSAGENTRVEVAPSPDYVQPSYPLAPPGFQLVPIPPVQQQQEPSDKATSKSYWS